MSDTFGIGDRVFAKVRGFPPWPGKIENLVEQTSKNKKYLVYFYGTDEKALCTGDNVFKYEEYKTIFGKPRRRKAFNLALAQIENADEDGNTVSPTYVPKDICEIFNQKESTISLPVYHDLLLLNNSKGSSAESPGASESKVLSCDRNDSPKPLPDTDYSRTEGDCKAKTKRRYPRRERKILPDDKTFEHKKKRGLNVKSKNVNGAKGTQKSVIKRKSSARTSHKDKITNKHSEANVQHSSVQENVLNTDQIHNTYKSNSMLTDELESYKTQTIMLEIEHQLCSNLFKRDPNIATALNVLYELKNLEVKPLMLKKHPQVVWTINKLRNYNPNNLVHFTSSDGSEFNFKAFEVRKVSEMIFCKFRSLFAMPDDCTFWNFFSREISKFKNLTENMTVHEVCTLQTDPSYNIKVADEESKWNNNYDQPISSFKESNPEDVFHPLKEEKTDHGYLTFCGNGNQDVKYENFEQKSEDNPIKEEMFTTIKTEQDSDEFETEENWLKYL